KDHIVMTVDSKKLKQILLNLLSNAVKFTPAGGQVSVTAWETMSDETVTFEVADTGIGIAPKDISRAMSPFGQVDNTLKRKYEGTGLGLPLTKKFVEIMGGKFNIESELEKGTKIIFTLPKAPKVIDGVNVKMAS
ncbi:MAG: ATP-binding protein, partial [Proteobacteria bacterium]|nr:ATP-binding protein [Pseudomonadota bacterium]